MMRTVKWSCTLGIVFLFIASAFAGGPGNIAQKPLITSGDAPPNIMFLIDSSGSMINILPDDPYDPTVTYADCTNTTLIAPTSATVYVGIRQGQSFFYLDNTPYSWGTQPGKTVSNYPNRCFAPTQTYSASLYADSTNSQGNYSSGAGGSADYTGNYLNWYFGTGTINWGTSATNKPGTSTRLQVIQNVTTQIVNTLTGVRVGLARFNFASGAWILVGVNDIATNRSSILSAIASLDPSDWTPLAEALYQIGDYFVGSYGGSLTLHPGQANQTNLSASTVFSQTARFNTGVSTSSPIQYFCQKNFAVILTDGAPTQDTNIPSNSGLTDYDGDCSGANASNCLSFDRKIGEFYDPSGGSDYLDDIATALYDMDLRPDLLDTSGNKVKNNITTYTIGFADPSVTQTPLLAETAGQGGGLNLTADNATTLIQAFQNITSNIGTKATSQTAVAFNSSNLTANSAIYAAQFFTATWSGDVIKYPVSATGVIGGAAWSAATLLDAVQPTNRFIFTYNGDTKKAVPFRTLSALSAAAQADLKMSPSGSADSSGQLRLDYLRGDRTNETGLFRTRAHVLADIVDSSPIFVGAPASNWPNTAPFPTAVGSRYSDYQTSAANRRSMVYVGDNSGMLQAFDANTGNSVFSYIPSNLFSNGQKQGLHYLTDPTYDHLFYVDLTPTVQDVYIKTASNSTPSWRTVLVGGERGGGQGYFALDITSPGQFSESTVGNMFLWEISKQNNADLGYSFSAPTLTLMNNGRYAAIFGNGYNSTNGRAKLFIVFLDGGLTGTWTLGSDYLVLDTGVGTTSNLNGMSTPVAVDVDGNKTTDRIYAGDLYGNMWAFDVSNASTTQWKSAYGGSTPVPLFTAASNKPITAQPVVITNSAVTTTPTNTPNLLVLFGSGQFITTLDLTTTNTQSLFGIWDSGVGNLTESQLVQQTFSTSGNNRIMTNTTVPYGATGSSARFGWRVNLTAGERVITTPVVRSGIVFFTTFIPSTGSFCTSGGTGWLMGLNATNGGQPTNPIIDINNDSQVNATDNISGSVVSGIQFNNGAPLQPALRGDYIFVPTSLGMAQQYSIFPSNPLQGRLSWKELTR